MKRITTLFKNIVYLTEIDLKESRKIVVSRDDLNRITKMSNVNLSLRK
jgi:hypothetical protein